ncbi:hypothetical protein AVEN_247386-1, partial [Araneus ventricosus]
SPRHVQQNYQDAMAMVRKFGKPDLFLTFTCNPSWSEMLNSMEGVQRPEDRSDIIRGLPHAHILLESKIRTKDDIDKFVSAGLPDPCTDLRFQIVTKCMVHGPCGTININSPCMRDGQCCKSFPKQFKDYTEENVNGYPIYRKRATEPVQFVPQLKVSNTYINAKDMVLPRSKYKKEGALDHEEILSFVEGRYVSAPEAMWRLNEFNLSHKSHTVVHLAMHLPQQHPIVY